MISVMRVATLVVVVAGVNKKALKEILGRPAGADKFYTGGAVKLGNEFTKLFFVPPEGAPIHIDINELTSEEGLPSIVETWRERESGLNCTEFAFQFQPSSSREIRESVKEIVPSGSRSIIPYKLYVNEVGGQVRWSERLLDEKKVGKEKAVAFLVLYLPSKFEGGELTLTNKDGVAGRIDWGKEVSQGIVKWVCFLSESSYETAEVVSGNKITIVYYVDSDSATTSLSNNEETRRVSDSVCQAWVTHLEALFGGLDSSTYGYFLKYLYGFGVLDESDLTDFLKGQDLHVYSALKNCGFNIKLQVSYRSAYRYGPLVPLDVGTAYEDPHVFEDVISSEDWAKLYPIRSIRLLNKCKNQEKMAEYDYYYGYAGNEGLKSVSSLYGALLFVFQRPL